MPISEIKKLACHRNSILSAKIVRQRAIDRYMESPNICLFCNKVILVKNGQKAVETKEKRFCDRSCAAKYNNSIRHRKPKTITCMTCSAPFTKSNSIRAARCPDCVKSGHSYQREIFETRLKSWTNSQYFATTHFARRALIHLLGAKCQKCGWNKIHSTTGNVPVQVHHIDGNNKNNRRENVELLCPNCHSLTPNFMSLNKIGRGEVNRTPDLIIPNDAPSHSATPLN